MTTRASHCVRSRCRYLGDTSFYKLRQPSSPFGIDPHDPNAHAVLSLAKRRLRAMDFVGLAHRFLDSMTLLSWWLGLPPLNVTCSANLEMKLEWKQRNMSGAERQAAVGLSPTGVAIVEEQNALDVELYLYAVKLFEERWAIMEREAPERISSDRYTCHGDALLRCRPPERVRSPLYGARRRCFTYCTNAASEAGPAGERLRRAYESGCPPARTAAHALGERATSDGQMSSSPVVCNMDD